MRLERDMGEDGRQTQVTAPIRDRNGFAKPQGSGERAAQKALARDGASRLGKGLGSRLAGDSARPIGSGGKVQA